MINWNLLNYNYTKTGFKSLSSSIILFLSLLSLINSLTKRNTILEESGGNPSFAQIFESIFTSEFFILPSAAISIPRKKKKCPANSRSSVKSPIYKISRFFIASSNCFCKSSFSTIITASLK